MPGSKTTRGRPKRPLKMSVGGLKMSAIRLKMCARRLKMSARGQRLRSASHTSSVLSSISRQTNSPP